MNMACLEQTQCTNVGRTEANANLQGRKTHAEFKFVHLNSHTPKICIDRSH